MALRSRNSACLFLLGVALFLASSANLVAQTAGSGVINGTVTDATGAVVPHSPVVVTNMDTGVVHRLVTNSAGEYTLPFILPGRYEVLAGGDGFGKVDRKNLTLTVGETLTVNASLPAATVATQVEVTTAAPLLDTQQSAVTATVDSHLIANLPVASRNWDTFVLLAPNVVPDGGSGLVSFHGISGLYNQNYVDGANNNQMLFSEARGRASGAPYIYSLDSIQEFQAETADYSAEFGQAAGGVVNAVTRSGTNQTHGDLFYYLRYPSLNALDPYSKWSALYNHANPFLLTQPIHQQQQFGGSVGGPIIKDKLFYFFTYDGFRRVGKVLYYSTATISPTPIGTPSSTADISPTQCPTTVTAAMCSAGISFMQQLAGFNADGTPAEPPSRYAKENIFFPRIDYQLNEKNHLFVNFNFADFSQSNGYAGNPSYSNTSDSTNGRTDYHERFVIANWTDAITQNAVNEVRFQWGNDLETAGQNAPAPYVSLSSLEAYGGNYALPREAEPNETRWQATDVFNYNRGHHSFKFGGDVNIVHEIMINLYDGTGLYSYSGSNAVANFQSWLSDSYAGQPGDTTPNAGTLYTTFTQVVDAVNGPTAAAGGDNFYMKMYDGFAEDSWKVSKTLTFNLGVRYDLQLTPNPLHPNTSSAIAAEYNTKIKNVADRVQPRIGFAWQPWAGTVVRGGYGLFSGLNQGSTYYAMRVENGVYQVSYTLGSSGVPKLISFPNVLFPLPSNYASITGALKPVGANTPTSVYTFGTTVPGTVPSFHGLSPNFVPPLTQEMNLGVEQQLPGKMTLKVGYVGTRATRLPVFLDANLVGQTPSSTRTYQVTGYNGKIADYTLPFYLPSDRVNPALGALNTGFSVANLWYNSLATELRRPFNNGLELIVNETWSHSLDDDQVAGTYGTFYGGNPPLDPNNLRAEYGNSDLDLRNRFVATAVYEPRLLPENWTFKYIIDPFKFSGIYIAQDGQPIVAGTSGYPSGGDDGGPTGGVMSSGSGAATAGRPFYIGRNSQYGPGMQDLDFSIGRDIPIHNSIHMELTAEAFNLANHKIVNSVNSTYSSFVKPGSSGCPTTVGGSSTFGGCYVPYSPGTASAFDTPSSTVDLLYGPREMEFRAKLFF